MINYEYFKALIRGASFAPLATDALVEWAKRQEYVKVFEGTAPGLNNAHTLDNVFTLHNRDDRPKRTLITSMSVGDVVRLADDRTYVCAAIGWVEIPFNDLHILRQPTLPPNL